MPGAQATHSDPLTTFPTGQVKSAEMDRWTVAESSRIVGSDSVTLKSFFSKMMASRRRSIVDFSSSVDVGHRSLSAGKLISIS